MSDRTWRDADLRAGGGARPPSVGAVVRRARFGLAAARWGESVLLGAGAFCTTLAAAAQGGIALSGRDLWRVARLAGLAAGASWRLEHRTDARAVARALDRRLRHRGALLTAFEVENQGSPTPVALALRDRVLARLRTREALRSIAPPLALPVAAPLLGVALLALALDRNGEDEGGGWMDPAAMAGELDGLETATLEAMDEGTVDEGTARALNALDHSLDALAAALAHESEDPARLLERTEALDRELVDLRARVGSDPELARRLDRVRPHLDAARMGLAEETRGRGSGETEPAAQKSEGGGGTMPGSTTSGTRGGSGARGGERASPGSAASGAESPASEVAAGPAPGSLAGRWWAEEYDGIVDRWVEYQRREFRERDAASHDDTPRD